MLFYLTWHFFSTSPFHLEYTQEQNLPIHGACPISMSPKRSCFHALFIKFCYELNMDFSLIITIPENMNFLILILKLSQIAL
jgi:hypothetical protein